MVDIMNSHLVTNPIEPAPDVSEYEARQFRMGCLETAARLLGPSLTQPDEVLVAAKKFASFVLDE
jgi:hypothetical protein